MNLIPRLFQRRSQSDTPSIKEPSYDLPLSMILKAIWAFLRKQERNVWNDTTALVKQQSLSPIIHDMEHLPEHGPFVLIPNHYERKDAVWVGWSAIAMTAEIARTRSRASVSKLHWVMTDTWADCYIGPFHVSPKYLGWVLKGFGGVYGIVRMPAHDLPNHDFQRPRSASALHEIFHALDRGECIAVHPEAGGFETLITPPPGAGRVLACFDRRHVPLVPVGVYEADGQLNIRFGEPLAAGTFLGLNDRDAAEKAMLAICSLVPERTRGVYAERYAASTPSTTTTTAQAPAKLASAS